MTAQPRASLLPQVWHRLYSVGLILAKRTTSCQTPRSSLIMLANFCGLLEVSSSLAVAWSLACMSGRAT